MQIHVYPQCLAIRFHIYTIEIIMIKNTAYSSARFTICTGILTALLLQTGLAYGMTSTNIPLDSRLYLQLEKLAGFGLITSDLKGIRPYTRAEVARLVEEASINAERFPNRANPLAMDILATIGKSVTRETSLRENKQIAPTFDLSLLSSARFRNVYLDGTPRSYERAVHDPGGDGVFGIGSGLRPDNPYPSPVRQRGTEGTPLMENSEGVRYGRGYTGELRITSEAFAGSYAAALIEPHFIYSHGAETAVLRMNKAYIKIGSAAAELEIGRDSAWLGQGYRGNITLTNNASNFDLVKLSSPEPIDAGFFGLFKYAFIASRFDESNTYGIVRQPWFYAIKLSLKPTTNLEAGLNLGRQVGGQGVNNDFGSNIRGLIGGSSADNSNSISGIELRYRIPWMRNTEIFGEFSGEDSAEFWPIVESYVAGVYVPRLTDDGCNDLRFEYFQGNQILYTNGTFPAGYIYEGMPIGHSQGGATQELFFRYGHWFSSSTSVALEYINTRRGVVGRLPGQAEERKNALRGFWQTPLNDEWNAEIMYGWERVDNFNLLPNELKTNHVFKIDISYKY